MTSRDNIAPIALRKANAVSTGTMVGFRSFGHGGVTISVGDLAPALATACQNREESGRLSLWRRGSVDLRGQMCRRGAGNTVGVLLARGGSRQWLITITHSIDSLSLILLLYTHHRHVGGCRRADKLKILCRDNFECDRQMMFRIGRWVLSCLNFVFLESKLGEVRPWVLNPVTGRLSLF